MSQNEAPLSATFPASKNLFFLSKTDTKKKFGQKVLYSGPKLRTLRKERMVDTEYKMKKKYYKVPFYTFFE